MPMSISREGKLALETMIDAHSLQAVVDALAEVCHAKAEHVATNWQDKHLARIWSVAGERLGKVRLPDLP